MKKIKLILEDEVAIWAQQWATYNNSSVSRLIDALLRQRMQEESGYQTAMEQYLSRKPKPLNKSGNYPSRDEMH